MAYSFFSTYLYSSLSCTNSTYVYRECGIQPWFLASHFLPTYLCSVSILISTISFGGKTSLKTVLDRWSFLMSLSFRLLYLHTFSRLINFFSGLSYVIHERHFVLPLEYYDLVIDICLSLSLISPNSWICIQQIWIVYQPISFFLNEEKIFQHRPLVKRSAIWFDVLIGTTLSSPVITCWWNQWYFTAKCLDLGVNWGSYVLANFRAPSLSS